MFMPMIGGELAGEWHSEHAVSRLSDRGYRPLRITIPVPHRESVVDDTLVYVHESIPDDGVLAHLFKFYAKAP